MEPMLKYGCNSSQKSSRVFRQDSDELPVMVLNGRPGYISFLDALNSWQLVEELKAATGLPTVASFKHVSPAGATVDVSMPPELQKGRSVDDLELSPLACTYAKAYGTDRMSSYGDWVTLFDECDAQTARLILREVSDGITVPGYSAEMLEILKTKRKGFYSVVQVGPEYVPTPVKHKDVFGITFEQGHNNAVIDESLLTNLVVNSKTFFAEARRDLSAALITLKHTQPNSAYYTKDGQAIGAGARWQSRIHCTRLMENEADLWHLCQHPQILNLPFHTNIHRPGHDNTADVHLSDDAEEVLVDDVWWQFLTECPAPLSREEKRRYLSGITDVSLGSDVFSPFGDNIEHAHRSSVSFIAQLGGSIRDDHVIDTYNKHGIAMVFVGPCLFRY